MVQKARSSNSWIPIREVEKELGIPQRSGNRLCAMEYLDSEKRGTSIYVSQGSLDKFRSGFTREAMLDLIGSIFTMHEAKQFLDVTRRTVDHLRWKGIIKTWPYLHGFLTTKSELDTAKTHPFLLEQGKSPPPGCPLIEEVAADWKVSYNAVQARLGNEIALEEMKAREAAPKKRTPGKIDYIKLNGKRYLCKFEVAIEKKRRAAFFLPVDKAPAGKITTRKVGKLIDREDHTVRRLHRTDALPLEDIGGRLFGVRKDVLEWRGKHMRKIGSRWQMKPKRRARGWITAKEVSKLYGYKTDVTRLLRKRFLDLTFEKRKGIYFFKKDEVLALRDAHHEKIGKRYLPKPVLSDGEATTQDLCMQYGLREGDILTIREMYPLEYRSEFHTFVYQQDEFRRVLKSQFRKANGSWVKRGTGERLSSLRKARREKAREERAQAASLDPQPIEIPSDKATPEQAAQYFGRSIHWLHVLKTQFGVEIDMSLGQPLYSRPQLAAVRKAHFVRRSGRWVTKREAERIAPRGKLTRRQVLQLFCQRGPWVDKFAREYPTAVDAESDGEFFHTKEVLRIRSEHFVRSRKRWISKPTEPVPLPANLMTAEQVAEYFGRSRNWSHVLKLAFSATVTVVGGVPLFDPAEVEAIRARYFVEVRGRWVRHFDYPDKGQSVPEGKLLPRAAASLFGRKDGWLWRLERDFAVVPEQWKRHLVYDKASLLQIRKEKFKQEGGVYVPWPPPGKLNTSGAAQLFGRSTQWVPVLREKYGATVDEHGLFDEAALLAIRERHFFEEGDRWALKKAAQAPASSSKETISKPEEVPTKKSAATAPALKAKLTARTPASQPRKEKLSLEETSWLFGYSGGWARRIARRFPETASGDLENPVFDAAQVTEVRNRYYRADANGQYIFSEEVTSSDESSVEADESGDGASEENTFEERAAAFFGRSAPFLKVLERELQLELERNTDTGHPDFDALERIREEHFTEDGDGETPRWRWTTLSQKAAARLLGLNQDRLNSLISAGKLSTVGPRLERGQVVELRYRNGAPEGYADTFTAAEIIDGSQTALEMYVERGALSELDTPRGPYYGRTELERIAEARRNGDRIEASEGMLDAVEVARVLNLSGPGHDVHFYVRNAIIAELTTGSGTRYYATEIRRLRESFE